MRRKLRDFVAWEGVSKIDGETHVAVIVTGITTPSRNAKTGPMWQAWTLLRDVPPMQAVKSGEDSAICGKCPLRGTGGGELRTCYVQLWQSPSAIWKAYQADKYQRPDREVWERWMKGAAVRLGAYGEPTAAPASVMYSLLEGSRTWSGYTHRWAELSLAGRAEPWRNIIMASVESEQQAHDAQRLGWRPYLALPEGEEVPSGAFLCPAEREDNPLSCDRCGACKGTAYGAVNPTAAYPYTPMHGSGRNNYRRMLSISPV